MGNTFYYFLFNNKKWVCSFTDHILEWFIKEQKELTLTRVMLCEVS